MLGIKWWWRFLGLGHIPTNTTTPKTRQEFWQTKFAANVERDSRNRTDLQQLGWHVIVVWECELRQPSDLKERLTGLFPQLDQNR